MIWLFGCAVAGVLQWGPAVSWERIADDEGFVEVAAGMPLRFEGEAPPDVRDENGRPLEVQALEDGWQLAPAPRRRRVQSPGARVRRVDRRLENARWAAWEHDTMRAIARDAPVPVPPDGATRLSERVELRAAAVDRATAQLGLWADLHAHHGLSRTATHRRRSRETVIATGATWATMTQGPIVTVWMRPAIDEAFVRTALSLSTENGPLEPLEVATTGRYRTPARRLAPAGELRLMADDVPLEVAVRDATPRPFFFVRDRPSETTPLGQTETAIMLGAVDLDALRTARTAGTPAEQAWARVRLIEHTDDPAELLALADPSRGDMGLQVIGEAVVRRALDLPIDVVLAWCDLLDDPNPVALARWADTLPSTRPRGVDVFDRAMRGAPGNRDIARARTRHTSRATRWTSLDHPDAGTHWEWSETGPGAPRVRAVAGQTVTREVFTADEELAERIAVRAEDAVFTLAGDTYRADGAVDLAVGVRSGRVPLTVERGTVVLDADWTGGEPVYAWRATPLPATWPLPDPGAAIELRVRGVERALLEFDDGRIVTVAAGTSVIAGPHARSVRVASPDGGEASAAILARAIYRPTETASPMTADVALATVDRATREIDGGRLESRAARAEALAWLGRRRSAWTDVQELGETHPVLARKTWSRVAAVPLFSPLDGPLDVVTATAAADEARAAVFQAIEDGDATAAVLAASAVPELMTKALKLGRFAAITRADDGNGLTPIERSPDAAPDTLSARIDAAILQSPWPREDTVVLGAGGTDVVRSPRGTLSVETWCRDTTLRREPCAVSLVGADVPGLIVRDGDRYDATATAGAIEVGPVDAGRRMAVRAAVDGELLAPRVRKLALDVNGRTRLTVPRDSIVRVDPYDGSVEASGHVFERLHHVPDGRLALSGRGLVGLAVLEPREQAVRPDQARSPRPRPEGVLQTDDVWPELGRTSYRSMGRGGSLLGSVRALSTNDGQFQSDWFTVEGEARWLATRSRGWTVAEAFVRAPGGAGFEFDQGFGSLHRFLAIRTRGAIDPTTGAGHAGGRLHLRQDIGSETLFFRAELQAFANYFTLQPFERTDPRIWSRDGLIHFLGLTGRAALRVQPWRDARMELWTRVRTNADPSLDRMDSGLTFHLLPWRNTRFVVDPTLRVALPDRDRADIRVVPEVVLGADRDVWSAENRIVFFARGRVRPGADLTGFAGVSVHFTRGRGLRDIPPTEVPFRSAREAR